MVDPFFRTADQAAPARVGYDAGLRAHMQRIFSYMALGLGLTGIVAYVVANTPLAGIIYGSPLSWVVMLAPLAFVLFLNFRLEKISMGAAQLTFWLFCGVMGLSMGAIFLVYTEASIARVFFITAANFGVMALWGYTTRSSLAGMGAFLMMGLFGLLIASLVNLFMASPMLHWITSIIGVVIFTGLTAWNVQTIKQSYNEGWGAEANGKLAVMGALQLYMNFINAFMYLLRLMGNSRN